MLNKIKNPKKGVAIELAVVALVVVFSLSALLVSLAVMSNNVGKKSLDSLTEKTMLSQTAKSYLDGNNTYSYDSNVPIDLGNGYTVSLSNYQNTEQPQFVFTKNGGKYKLTVIIRPSDNYKIVTWSYSLN